MRVLVTGATGQIGFYLARLLVAEGHAVVGLGSPRSEKALPPGVERARGAWTDEGLDALMRDNGALDAVVHLGAPTSIPRSWEDPAATFDAIARLTARLAYALAKEQPGVRLVAAGTSNIFGRSTDAVLTEETRVAPVSPYGVAKAAAHFAVKNAREALGAPQSNLIFFQGLSRLSPPGLVLRKITRGVADVLAGRAKTVRLGTMGVVRDVSHAEDFARAAALLALGDATPGDYCCCSGVGRSIRAMAEIVCRVAELEPERAIEDEHGYQRPSDIPSLVGDPTKLRALGWAPLVSFEALAKECLEADLAALEA